MRKSIVWILATITVLLLLYVLRGAITLALVLLLVSATFAFLISPLCKRLERYMKGGIAAIISVLALLLFIVGVVLLVIPSLLTQAGELIGRIPAIAHTVQSWLDDGIDALSLAGVPDTLLDGVIDQINNRLPALLSGFENILMGLGSFIMALGQYLLTPILGFYLLRDRRQIIDFMLRITPSKARATLMRIGAAAHRELGRYVRGQLLITASTGISTAIGLWIAGMPTFLIMGVIMSIFNLIPFIGPFIGAIPILLFAAADSLSMLIKALVVVLITQQIESVFVTPRIMSGVARIHPIVVMLLLVCSGVPFGLLGLIFCIPTYIVLRCVISTILEQKAIIDV